MSLCRTRRRRPAPRPFFRPTPFPETLPGRRFTAGSWRRVRPGAYADLVVPSGDTLKVPVSRIVGFRICPRIAEGRTVHR